MSYFIYLFIVSSGHCVLFEFGLWDTFTYNYKVLKKSATLRHSVIFTQVCVCVFQLFRETKEGEIQNLLRTKREAENRLSKLMHGLTEDMDTASRSGLGDLGDFFFYNLF